MKLKEKVTIITGAASGIGRATAIEFAREGAHLILADINEPDLHEVTRQLQADGCQVISKTTDVTIESEIEQLLDTAEKHFGKIDCLINNAGIMDHFTPIEDTDTKLFDRVMATNVNSVFYACRSAVRRMRSSDASQGCIINIASGSGLIGGRAGVAYTASKHAVVGITKQIGVFYRNQNIRCNALCPGGVDTPLINDPDAHPDGLTCARHGLPLGREILGQPSEIARAAVFLASEDASYINGATLVIDGGWTAF